MRTHIDSVNAEYRQLEDYVYCLEDENAKLQRQLDHIRKVRSGEEPARSGPFRRQTEASPAESEGASGDAPLIEMPGSATPSAPQNDRSSLQRPRLDEPTGSAGTGELTLPLIEVPSSRSAEPANRPEPAELPKPGDPPTPARPKSTQQHAPETLPVMPADGKVTHLFLNPLRTGGVDFDSQPGDEGLSIVLEPRNAADEYVPQAGAISVAVLDPTKQGDAARIARWDFTLTATEQKLQNTPSARGIQLEMPWPASPPANGRLHVFVRFEGADGRRLQTDREIFVTPPGQVAERWTPRSPTSQRQPANGAIPAASAGPQPAASAAAEPSSAAKMAIGRGDKQPPIVSPITAPPPQLLAPPPALNEAAAKKPTSPQWSPNR